MAFLQVKEFGGIIPVTGDRALRDNFATKSVNTWLYGSELRGLRPPVDIVDINSGTKKVFRIPKRTAGGDPTHPGLVPPPSYLGDSVWNQFTDPDTDIVKGQLLQDSFERYYFCSPTAGPSYNTYARLQAGLPGWKLGVPGPPVSPVIGNTFVPTVAVTGGSAPVLTRSYLYTWVNIYGEESPPSLPVTASGNANGTWTVSGIDDPVSAPAYAGYLKKRLYRTITGASGQTTFYFVADVALGTFTYADDGSVMTDAVLASSLLLESTNWNLPPDTLKGFIAMPNGFLIGFDGNTLFMSESYHFHAWPPEYQQAVEVPIVGLGVLGTTCVVCTQGYPSTISGVKPATCSFTKSNANEPCLSRGSIVPTPNGILYASQNGLILIGPSGIQNVTQQLITRDDWLRIYNPTYIRAIRYQDGYMAQVQEPGKTGFGFFVDPSALKVALTTLSDFDGLNGLVGDFWSGEVFIIPVGKVRRWDPPTDDLMPVQWRSKEFQYLFKENFGAYAIYWDDARYSVNPYGAALLPVNEKVRFKVYADRTLVYDSIVPLNGRAVRLPSGFKADIWQFEILARAPVYSLQVASSIKELKGV